MDDWTTPEVVRASGVTSRTLRHYDRIGVLRPSRTGPGGLRHYDRNALVRLQKILIWRDLGMPLSDIARLLDGETDDRRALAEQRKRLEAERDRLTRQMDAVDRTIDALKRGREIMPTEMFDGFDHTRYDAEVRSRWGDEAADRSNAWWEGLGASGKAAFRAELEALNDAWDALIADGSDPRGEAAQKLAERHVAWILTAWDADHMPAAALKGISDMYVDDERFAANYTRVSAGGARFVRDALHRYADTALE